MSCFSFVVSHGLGGVREFRRELQFNDSVKWLQARNEDSKDRTDKSDKSRYSNYQRKGWKLEAGKTLGTLRYSDY